MISEKFQCLTNIFLVEYASFHYSVQSKKSYLFYWSFSWSGYTNNNTNDNLHDIRQYFTVNYSTLLLLNSFNTKFGGPKNPLLLRLNMTKSLNFVLFLVESVSCSNISSLLKLYHKRFGKFKTFSLKLYLGPLFPSWHLQWKFLKLVFLNSEEKVTDWSWLNRS